MLRTRLTPIKEPTPNVATSVPPYRRETFLSLLTSRFSNNFSLLHSNAAKTLCQQSFGSAKVTSWKGLACVLPFVFGCFGMSGCATTSLKQTAQQRLGVEYQTVETTKFPLSSVVRLAHADTLRIYLGGDGRPWKRGSPSNNPSGTERLAFELFLKDPKATHYISRPCYDIEPMPSDCQAKLWTSDRYSSAVIASLTEAISQLAGNSNIELVGHSGGGTLAVLLAQQMPQVTRILTLGANLDHTAWTNFHNTPALSGSANAATTNRRVSGQELHLYGQDDREVPAALNQKYFDNNPSANIGIIDNFDHSCCWLEQWPDILNAWENSSRVNP